MERGQRRSAGGHPDLFQGDNDEEKLVCGLTPLDFCVLLLVTFIATLTIYHLATFLEEIEDKPKKIDWQSIIEYLRGILSQVWIPRWRLFLVMTSSSTLLIYFIATSMMVGNEEDNDEGVFVYDLAAFDFCVVSAVTFVAMLMTYFLVTCKEEPPPIFDLDFIIDWLRGFSPSYSTKRWCSLFRHQFLSCLLINRLVNIFFGHDENWRQHVIHRLQEIIRPLRYVIVAV